MWKNIQRLKILLSDKDKKPWWIIGKEVFFLILIKKSFPLYYFGRFFYKKGAPNGADYMNAKICESILYAKKLQRKPTISILNNKLYFSLFCQANSIATPNMLAYNLYGSFFYRKQLYKLFSTTEFYNFCSLLFKESTNMRIFIKLSESMGGKGIFRITPLTSISEYKVLWPLISNDSFIFQEEIEQHASIIKIFPNSINTVRLETYLKKDGSLEILGGMMRFGSGKSTMDNVSLGGLFVPINLDNGTLLEKGMTNLLSGAHEYTHHPTTGYKFHDFKIPFYKKAVELCKKSAQLIPNRLIGWDIAITPNGPLIIEGNHNPGLLSSEFSYNGFMNKPIFQEILQEI